ncbi:DUF4145 domain-containing protein [Micromonospora sp. NBC_01796]|uniref:DUF4145 domain-containing protein n=1 Tax=Micromonospora sp. NBC_01796 TaxID=2975987 RepID=UPI002DD9E7D9|nr:DUF4145 domain-containing protein [Micromonospora sp. NBC_01796]WSA83192.1 DUF4145 domain-containing protein [Micromonospora sp. NBC_01796]
MAATTCPFCHSLTNFQSLQNLGTPPLAFNMGRTTQLHTRVEMCANELCHGLVITVVDGSGKILRMWPEQVGGKQFSDVPDHIAETADEAYRCNSIKAYRAAVLLARSAIEATAKQKGITTGSLVSKIDQMHTNGLIREYVKEGAHEVRHLGNDMAHGDFVDPVSPEDTDLVLTLMDEVLEEVFQAPERVAKARAARFAKKQTAAR